jgi:hypothetical protein
MEDRTGKARRLSVTRAENQFFKVQTLAGLCLLRFFAVTPLLSKCDRRLHLGRSALVNVTIQRLRVFKLPAHRIGAREHSVEIRRPFSGMCLRGVSVDGPPSADMRQQTRGGLNRKDFDLCHTLMPYKDPERKRL